ncbi:hypothetical protein NDA11_007113 [Ustilago hordei]|uniref:Uncharacterized protein n=1 Tax=Ustilago hordei TaxID=120017 RepID=I2FS24_USTHO|nr:uncharacterized protein UHO2_05879 [Ustilago hordei]KAJ1573306.1 hypothetical protein NDA15_003915 [Ustilago hordei]KAJ1574850.1 hypothetical protein NDA12_006986 [Ustilago hordei]KAJ1576774.1 hypothetical protein NDA11_007113 [Ustilago hordei]KAJ1596318.1 hypothetical protein NDA14_004093 [Ustilago hordei]CCF49717.1 uncharacterized protein UHOR_08060 [Ustilago hordei]
MDKSDRQSVALGPSTTSAIQESQSGTYDHLPDLSVDISMGTSSTSRPAFEQLNATLISRGYLRLPLNVAGMREDSLSALADALHALIAQREEDIEVRTALTAKNRTLTASLERTKRFQKEEIERSADFERKAEASKSKLIHLSTQLETERNAHKATKEALGRMRRDLQAIKASALQYKTANDRSVARVRARIGEVTNSAIRSAVPDFQIVASAFDDVPNGSSSKAGAAGVYAQQVQELEQKRAHLVEYNQALKRFATEAINAARRADQELVDIVEAEEDDARKRDDKAASKPLGDSNGSRSASSSSVTGMGASNRSSPSDAWLDGHRPLFQRDLFPTNDTLRSTPAGTLVSGSSSKSQHPALRALELTSTTISAHIQSLLDRRTERSIYESSLRQRMAAEAREQAWAAKLEQDVHEDLQNDVRLSLNKTNGPAHIGSLASAAIVALSGSGGSRASGRVDWQREKVDLEKKLAQLVKEVAVAEQHAARKEKEVKKLAEAEQRARSLLDQVSSSAATGKAEKSANDSEEMQQVDALREELHNSEGERARLASRCEMLEAEARELRNERNRVASIVATPAAPNVSAFTSLKRLNDAEVAEIHARDQRRRTDLGSLSVVAEDSEMPSLTSTADTVETASDDVDGAADTSKSLRTAPKSQSNKGSANADMMSPGESFGNNPELDAIFGVSKPAKAVKAAKASDLAPRRSSRLSGGSTAAGANLETALVEESKNDLRNAKTDEEEAEPTVVSKSASKRRASQRISDGLLPVSEPVATDESSSRASKRSRAEQSAPSSGSSLAEADAATKPTLRSATSDAGQSRRRLSTREKQELEQRQKLPRTVPGPAAAPTKTPALSSRRIVSGSSSSVTRPTAASLRRSEATLASSAKRPLSNATNTGEGLAKNPESAKVKTQSRTVSESSVVRTRS